MYDEQFRYLRQSAPESYPWDAVHWELWLKATTSLFRSSKQATLSAGSTCSKAHQPFPRSLLGF